MRRRVDTWGSGSPAGALRPKPHLALALPIALAALAPAPAEAAHALGLNAHQSMTVGPDATRDAGLGWVRVDFNWLDAQPANAPADFTLFDAIVDAAIARGLSVLAVVGYTPAWASTGDLQGDGPTNDVPVPGAYEAFVQATVQHFQGRITHYELWNEPNLDVFFEGTPDQYTSLILLPGAAAVHAACPACKVVAPGLATVGGEYDVWMDAALAAGKDQIDIVSGHVYADFGPGTTSDNFFQKLEQHRVLEVAGQIVYEGPRAFREVMDAHGVTAPFWLTETGKEAPFGDAAAEQDQLRYYRQVLESALTRPWWEATIFYEAFDEPNTGYTWGVVLHDDAAPGGYRPKAVMGLLQKVTAAQPLFGGTGTDCDDGLDNEGDGLIDYPDDPDCASALGTSEGEPPMGTGGGGGGGGPAAGLSTPPSAAEDCGCRTTGAGSRPTWIAAIAAAALALARRRR